MSKNHGGWAKLLLLQYPWLAVWSGDDVTARLGSWPPEQQRRTANALIQWNSLDWVRDETAVGERHQSPSSESYRNNTKLSHLGHTKDSSFSLSLYLLPGSKANTTGRVRTSSRWAVLYAAAFTAVESATQLSLGHETDSLARRTN